MNNRLHDDSGLLRQSILMMAGTLIGALCNAAFHMAVGRILPNAEYGALAAMLGLILVVGTPMLAVQNTLAHYIAILQRENRAAEIRPLCLRWLRFFVALAIIMVAAAIFFRHQLAAFWHVSPALIVTTFAVQAITLWLSLLYGLLQGMQAFVWLAIAPQAWGALRLLLGWAFTAFVAAQALLAVVAQGIGVIAVLLLGAIAIRQMQLPRGRAGTPPPDTLRYLGASLVALVGYAMLMNLDVTLAKHYFDSETAGLFARAAVIARTAVFLPTPIATVLFPKVTTRGEQTAESWRLLRRARALAGLLVAAAAGVCVLWPQLPWTILYGRWTPDIATHAAQWTRAMALAMSPLAMASVLLNFNLAQRRFVWCYSLIPCALGYIGGVAIWHDSPWQLAAVLGVMNLLAAILLWAASCKDHRATLHPPREQE